MNPAATSESFERCMSVGGIAVFPADTVYGLACDPANRIAVERLYGFKRRPPAKPSAVMFFDVSIALAALPELGERTRLAVRRLLPGALTLLLPNPAHRFPLACGEDPSTLGLRVPVVPALAGVRWPVLQSSANLAGGPEARVLAEVPERLRRACDLVIDGGELPGTASTVIDLRSFEDGGEWTVIREGAVPFAEIASVLEAQFHFDPASYGELIRKEIPGYDAFQDELVAAGEGAGQATTRILELGTGTGETAVRLLARYPEASLLGIDASEPMLAAARARLPAARVELRVARLEDPLPEGPFDLVASALCVHHLPGEAKAELFARIAGVLAPGGRFALGDVIVPSDAEDAVTPLTDGFDHPSPVADQLAWLRAAGFDAAVTWASGDLAVIAATQRG